MADVMDEKEAIRAGSDSPSSDENAHTTEKSDLINASGHVQELERNFNLLTLAGVGLVTGSVWPAAGGSILVAIFNGGPPGVIYEFIVVSAFYWIIAACIAELSSAIPSSGGVYHWASVTPGKSWGRVVGFYAGYWNWLAWVFGSASMSFIFGNTCVQMYGISHPDFVAKQWHVFVCYLIWTWMACLCVCLMNKWLPHLNTLGIFFILGGFLITVIVVAAMPGTGGCPGHASSSFVWSQWQANIGYSNGFVFVAGMLNGAYAVGTPDCVSHLAEEIPNPAKNVPIAIALQMIIGFLTGLFYIIAIMYAIHDYEALFTSPYPIAAIYQQATGSNAGAIGLLFLVLCCIAVCTVGTYITNGRTLWTLARDGATPFPQFVSKVSPNLGMPFNATILCGVLVTALGCIYVGSSTAFNAFVGSFVLMSSASYFAAIFPNLVTGRKNIRYGTFKLKGLLGPILNAIACGYIVVWFVIYCFPYYLPTNAQTMNYASLIWGGLTIFITMWWFIGARKDYVGPTTTGGISAEIEHAKHVSVHAKREAPV